jgi:AcrR family transcriptional regulator
MVRAAVDEFAAHGFRDGSLNRIIEAAGVSKGSLYYYFDGKEDLYAYVTRLEFERLFADLGPFHAPVHEGPDGFWAGLERYYVELMSALAASPQLAALTRGWLAASGNAALDTAQQEMERVALPWIARTLTAGQDLGAIRTDLPSGLLIAVVVGMGQAMDTWLVAEQPDPATRERWIHTFITMIRAALTS